jgi:hypothetical protein
MRREGFDENWPIVLGRHDDTSHSFVPAVREDGPEVSSGQRDVETDDRWEHPFPRTGRALHALATA